MQNAHITKYIQDNPCFIPGNTLPSLLWGQEWCTWSGETSRGASPDTKALNSHTAAEQPTRLRGQLPNTLRAAASPAQGRPQSARTQSAPHQTPAVPAPGAASSCVASKTTHGLGAVCNGSSNMALPEERDTGGHSSPSRLTQYDMPALPQVPHGLPQGELGRFPGWCKGAEKPWTSC